MPRTRERAMQSANVTVQYIMGVDEAGRGPLAGPVVAAAAIVPTDIPGIVDSKLITNEQQREQLYDLIVHSPNATWAVAVVDAPRIDDINILQATMQAMSMAIQAIVMPTCVVTKEQEQAIKEWKDAVEKPVCIQRTGCYVSCGGVMLVPPPNNITTTDAKKKRGIKTQKISPNDNDNGDEKKASSSSSPYCYALVDGNRLPTDLPCGAEFMIRGDSREYAIAAASILAKVTRDRLMRAYARVYPHYNLQQHKGYPTKAHMAAVFQYGATPIHRRTFAPLKHMEFQDDGRVYLGGPQFHPEDDDSKKKKKKRTRKANNS